MKVYLCWQHETWEKKLLGIFLHHRDAYEMKTECETEGHTCIVEEHLIIE